MTTNKKALWQAGLIIALPVIAVVAGYLFFPSNEQQRDNLLSWLGTTNHGVLIEPVRTIADLTFATPSGENWQAGGNSKWKLAVVDNGNCDEPCQNALYLTRQIHKLIAKRANRVERLYISEQSLTGQQQQMMEKEYPATTVLLDRSHQFQQQLADTNVPDNRTGFFYLLDSRGQLVLFYTPEHEYKKVIKDLKVLL